MNEKTSVFVICVEAIIYLLLYNLYDYTLKVFRPLLSLPLLYNLMLCKTFFYSTSSGHLWECFKVYFQAYALKAYI